MTRRGSYLPPRRPTLLLGGSLLMLTLLAAVTWRRDGATAVSAPSHLTITLMPRLGPTPGVAVFMRLQGEAAVGLRSLAMAPVARTGSQGAPSVRHLLVKDADGVILTGGDGRTGRFRFAHPSAGGWLSVSYLAEVPPDAGHVDVHVDAAGVRAVGYSLLALPPLREPLEVELRWDTHALEVPAVASSFGSGRVVHTRATVFELAHAFYVAGPLRTYRGDRGEQLVVWGQPAFSPRAALEIYSTALHAARALFEPFAPAARHSFFLFAEPGLDSRQDGLAFPSAFAVWADEQRPLDARLELLIGHEVVHRYIGGTVRLDRPDGSDARWFSEGLAVYYARKLLLDAGLISAQQFADDVERDVAAERLELSQPPVRRQRARWRHRPLTARSHPAPAYHRGALYAARVEARLRARGKIGLDDVVRDLVATGELTGGTLPEQAWIDQLATLLGPGLKDEIETSVVRAAAPIVLPRGAFGPCFERVAFHAWAGRSTERWQPRRAPGCPPPGTQGEQALSCQP